MCTTDAGQFSGKTWTQSTPVACSKGNPRSSCGSGEGTPSTTVLHRDSTPVNCPMPHRMHRNIGTSPQLQGVRQRTCDLLARIGPCSGRQASLGRCKCIDVGFHRLRVLHDEVRSASGGKCWPVQRCRKERSRGSQRRWTAESTWRLGPRRGNASRVPLMQRPAFRCHRRGLSAAATSRALLLACMLTAISTSHASPQPIVFAQGCDLTHATRCLRAAHLPDPPPNQPDLFSRHTPLVAVGPKPGGHARACA